MSTGVHDHGFNNVSTYGNWLRLQREDRLEDDQLESCELALKVSGAVQASRWSKIREGGGFIYSFNGPHSLFVDTVRSCRILMVAHRLGHRLKGENDCAHSLLERALKHLETTAKYSIYYGEGRDFYDVPEECGRTAHEAIFNPNDELQCYHVPTPSKATQVSHLDRGCPGRCWALRRGVEFLPECK